MPCGWHALSPRWQAGQPTVQKGLPHDQLAPAWQILLLGDGSPTRHLQLLTRDRTEVDVIDMAPVGMDLDGAPDIIRVVPGPRLRRQVWVRTASGQELTAQYVICTVPLGVLRTGGIQLEPPLPAETEAALGRLGVGRLEKLWLEFDAVSGEVRWRRLAGCGRGCAALCGHAHSSRSHTLHCCRCMHAGFLG